MSIRLPGAEPIGRKDALVELTDITATILDYAGLDPAKALSRPWPAYNAILPGRSLLPLIRGEAERVRDFAFSESDFTEERDGVYCSYTREEYQRIRGKGRGTAWQMIQSPTHKYVKYLGYDAPGGAHEELYDLVNDPDETNDVAGDPAQREALFHARERLTYVRDSYPPAQKTWTDSRLAQMRH